MHSIKKSRVGIAHPTKLIKTKLIEEKIYLAAANSLSLTSLITSSATFLGHGA